MRTNILIIFLLFTGYSLLAQENTDTSMKTFMKADLSFSGLGLSLETPLSNKFLIETEAGLGAGYDIGSNSFNYTWQFDDPSFYASVRGKYYYNREKRAAKGKGIFMNAGNFIGFRVKYTSGGVFESGSFTNYGYYCYNNGYGNTCYEYLQTYYSGSPANNTLLGNIHWGIQRQLGKHWMYSLYAGVGCGYDLDYEWLAFYPAIDLKISYVLPFFGKKNKQ